jgi:hypothetical protein
VHLDDVGVKYSAGDATVPTRDTPHLVRTVLHVESEDRLDDSVIDFLVDQTVEEIDDARRILAFAGSHSRLGAPTLLFESEGIEELREIGRVALEAKAAQRAWTRPSRRIVIDAYVWLGGGRSGLRAKVHEGTRQVRADQRSGEDSMG